MPSIQVVESPAVLADEVTALVEAAAAEAAALAVADCTPLGENRYKVPLLKALVRRALQGISDG